MLKRKIISICLSITFIFCLSGCMELEESREQVVMDDATKCLYEETAEGLPEHLTAQLSDKVELDADIIYPEQFSNYEISEIQLKRHIFQVEDVANVFSKYMNSKWEGEIKESEDLLENGKTVQRLNAKYENGADCFAKSFCLWFDGNFLEKGSSLIGYDDYLTQQGLEYATQEDLDFKSVADAEKDIRSVLDELGIPDVMDTYMEYTATEEGLKKAASSYGSDLADYLVGLEIENVKVEKNDEMYQFVFRQGKHGIAYTGDAVLGEETGSIWSSLCSDINVRYGENGIDRMDVGNIYEYIEDGEKVKILEPGKVLDQFLTDKERDLNVNSVSIKYIAIEYLPYVEDGKQMVFKAVPVWKIAYEEIREGMDSANTLVAFYNGQTGRKCGI